MKEWKIVLKCGAEYNLRVKGFSFADYLPIICILCAYNKLVVLSIPTIENRHDLTLYTGGCI